MKIRQLPLLALFAFAACGEHPLAGNWSQETGVDAVGMTLEFDADSNKLMVHLAPRPDGGHDHVEGSPTYSFDAATMAVTVNAKLMGDDKADTWTGKLDGELLELGAADTKLKFKKGGSAH